jgi:hypothetical protein
MTTLQKALAGATLAVAVGTAVYQARQAARLRLQNETLLAQREQLTANLDAALAAARGKETELEQLRRDNTELPRLRNEVGTLRRQTNELAKIREENRQLRAASGKTNQSVQRPDTDSDSDPQRQVVIAKMTDAKLLGLGLILYTRDHQNQYPLDFDQITNYWANTQQKPSGTNVFELVAQGPITGITNPMDTIVVREKEPSFLNGKWVKAYGFADGHSQLLSEPPEGFEAWENAHIQPRPSAP